MKVFDQFIIEDDGAGDDIISDEEFEKRELKKLQEKKAAKAKKLEENKRGVPDGKEEKPILKKEEIRKRETKTKVS